LRPMRLETPRLVHFFNLHGEKYQYSKGAGTGVGGGAGNRFGVDA
jgi:hypothetical protein